MAAVGAMLGAAAVDTASAYTVCLASRLLAADSAAGQRVVPALRAFAALPEGVGQICVVLICVLARLQL